ncbi:MAG TPA: flagellar motor switch protein FliG [Cyanobacteria bacterium UBA8530]|nr:flagellar motor switch protein FliG [Cyanobacteria bacterium UBA8530]
MRDIRSLTGRDKVAALMVALGPEASTAIIKSLESNEDIEAVTLAIANLGMLNTETSEAVLEEFYYMLQANEYISSGGIGYARELLAKALGPDKAESILHRLADSLTTMPFEFIRQADPTQLLNFIQSEHPQTIALILAYMRAPQAALVLGGLEPELQIDVATRIAQMDRTNPAVLREVEKVLEKKFSAVMSQDFTNTGGIPALVEMLNNVDRSTEKTIIESLEEQNPDLAEEIKKLMFVFEDIVLLDDRSIQRVLRDIETKDLALALKGANDDVRNRIFKNLSERMGSMVRDELAYLGPVRVRDIEDVQQKIVSAIRGLEERGEIIISRGGADEVVD